MSTRGLTILPVVLLKHSQSSLRLDVTDTPLRRWFVLATLRLLGRILPRHGPVLILSKKLCIKVGTLKQPAEAATMQFVAQHTAIPVPKVHCAFERKGYKYLLMERVQGHILRDDWLTRSAEFKEKILAQIKDMVEQMRRIPPPSG